MRKVRLIRKKTSDEGTFGTLITDVGNKYSTGELPWRDNRDGVSCIPIGTYTCEIYHSPKHGNVYQVINVPDRDSIEMHSGNWCGDKSKGLKSDVLGCIILGIDDGMLAGQWAVIHSKTAIQMFMDEMKGEPFQLEISE